MVCINCSILHKPRDALVSRTSRQTSCTIGAGARDEAKLDMIVRGRVLSKRVHVLGSRFSQALKRDRQTPSASQSRTNSQTERCFAMNPNFLPTLSKADRGLFRVSCSVPSSICAEHSRGRRVP